MGKQFKPYVVGEYRLGALRGGYCVTWNENNRRRRYQLDACTEEEARVALHDFVRTRKQLIAQPPTDTLKDLSAAYIADREAEGKSSTRNMRYGWNVLGETFNPLRPADITRAICRDYAAMRLSLGRKPHTVHGELRLLRSIVNWAKKAELIARAPHIWMPPMPEPRDRYLTRGELNALLANAEMPHVKLFIILAISTASRMTALLQLTWDRVDFERGLIALHDPNRPRTNKGRALVPMNGTARAALLEARKGALSNSVIEWNGLPIKNIRRGLHNALVRAGLKVPQDGAHLLRHTSAVLMAEDGIPMSEIAQYLGHRSVATTERIYARFSPDYLRRAAASLEFTPFICRGAALGSPEPDAMSGTENKEAQRNVRPKRAMQS